MAFLRVEVNISKNTKAIICMPWQRVIAIALKLRD